MSQGGEDFLRRWSRRKLAQRAEGQVEAQAATAQDVSPVAVTSAVTSAATSAATPATSARAAASDQPPPLPPLESVNFESDFRAFMHAKVDEGVRRAALKKLFADPRFNVMDGLDIYIDDYTKGEAVTEEFLATLKHARTTLFPPGEKEASAEAAPREDPAAAAAQPAVPESSRPESPQPAPGRAQTPERDGAAG